MRDFSAFFERFGWPADKGRLPFCIGHRGASGHAVENTLNGFRRAAELGAEMWELDTQMTADGVVVVSHDDHLERVFGKDMYISQATFEELRAAVPDVPSFEEVAALARETGCGLYVELKRAGTGVPCWQHLKALGQRFAGFGSFDAAQVRELRDLGCDYPLSILVRVGADPHALGDEAGADILHLCWEKASETPQEFVTGQLMETAFSAGREIMLWHEERPAVLKEIMALPVLGICTDQPDLMRPQEEAAAGGREMRRVTSFDVARVAGVSRAAVSRAFTPDASVSQKTREKVYEAARELGYRVNYLARSLTKTRSDFVGLVAAGLDNPFRTQQIEHLSRALIARDYRPILLPTSKEADTSTVIGQLLHYAVSGVIVTSDAPPSDICEECAVDGVPIVLINKGEDYPFVDRVVSDDRMSGHAAVDHLIEQGAGKLAVMAGAISYSARRRAEAFLGRCAALGVEAQLVPVALNDYRHGLEAARQLLDLGIDGLFSANDYMACGVLDGLAEACPGESRIKVIGHDNIPQADWSAYRLTTFEQPCELQAEQVIDLLTSRMSEPETVARVAFTPVSLIKRKST